MDAPAIGKLLSPYKQILKMPMFLDPIKAGNLMTYCIKNLHICILSWVVISFASQYIS
jgi:hypothetical protein